MLVYVGDGDDPPSSLGYLPVTNLKKLMAGLPVPGGETPAANAKGVYEITSGGRTIYAKQKGSWAVLSDNEDSLVRRRTTRRSISDLTKKYLVGVRGNVQNVPAARRGQVLAALRVGKSGW